MKPALKQTKADLDFLAHQQNSTYKPRHTVGSVFWSVVTIGCALQMFLGSIGGPQKLHQVYEDFELGVPLLTRFVLSPAVTVLLGFVLIVLVIKEFIISDREEANKFNRRTLIALILFMMAYLTVAMMPLIKMVEQLSG